MRPQVFPLNGVAFAIAAFAGVVIRRTVVAMGTGIAASVGLAVATALYLRKNYEAAVVTKGPIEGGWLLALALLLGAATIWLVRRRAA